MANKANSILRGAIFLGCLAIQISAHGDTGKDLYNACIACHGENAQGNPALKAPALAGQSEAYLIRQLHNFSHGLRGAHPDDDAGASMVPMAKLLTDDAQRQAVSHYLSGLPLIKHEDKADGDMMNGARYYQAKCGACHGGNAEGNPAFNAPSLVGLSADYLRRQMHNFKHGIRGADKTDKPGRQMAAMAKTTPDEVLEDILHFVTHQEP